MIERVSVRDFILVESLDLEFTPGFNVLSGETGAGKSILVGALSLLMGAKGDTSHVRGGAQEAVVAGEFRVPRAEATMVWLDEHAIAPDDGRVLVRRVVRRSGRGVIQVQGVPVTRGELAEFAGLLVDLHSQHEHQSLFVESNHRTILDRFAQIEGRVAEFQERFSRLEALQVRQRELATGREARANEVEMLSWAIDEIEAAELREGEVEQLEREKHRLVQFERLAAHVESVAQLLDGHEMAIVPLLKRARGEFESAARIDEELTPSALRLENAYYEVEDLSRSLERYREEVAYDPARIEEINDRLALIRALFRKYGEGVTEVVAYGERAREKLAAIDSRDDSLEEVTRHVAELMDEVAREARALHEARAEAAGEVERRIMAVLRDLAMGRSVFVVEVSARTNAEGRMVCGPRGADDVRFLISTNPGQSPRPLSRVASGGEISRVMLAVKTVIAQLDGVPSLVFDEIDTGIGGQVALSIAEHLGEIASCAQVICITHLATIAARADNHIIVEKRVDREATSVGVRPVTGDEREREIARMLAGDERESHSIEHARALLRRYQREADGEDQ